MKFSRHLPVFLAALLCSAPAMAVDVDKFFSHSVELKGEANTEKKLMVDGREVHANWHIGFDDVVLVGGVPVLVGWSGDGGNLGCSAPFVLSFPADGAVRFDGPMDECAPVDHQLKGHAVVFSQSPRPNRDGRQWIWTPAEGFRESGKIPFTYKTEDGWQVLRERSISHPGDLMEYRNIVDALKQQVGAAFDDYQAMLLGTGSGEYMGDDFYGHACTPHNCGTEEAVLFASARNKRFYTAWTTDGKTVFIRPDVSQWPGKARQELTKWRKSFQ
ncbi:MAG: hypothetical protein LBR29_04555 [Methylobacteriaceae bacterium]|jgi:hypothetical protein|nr:hypothetical protein [Methylobacteriaceae bacterium]